MGLLDQLPSGAHSAYALSRLRDAYTGSAIRVRRDSDQAETDIGFASDGRLDLVALEAFHNNTNSFAYLVTWYDQTGNGNDLNQANAAFQPLISGYSSGFFFTPHDYPTSGIQSAYFLGTSWFPASLFYTPAGFSSIAVIKPLNNAGGEQFVFNIASGAVEAVGHMMNRFTPYSYVIRHDLGATDAIASISNVNNNSYYGITDFMNGLSTTAYRDTTLMTGTDFGRRNLGASYIGTRDTTGTYDLDAAIFSLIFYQSDQGANASSIQSALSTYYLTTYGAPNSITTGNPQVATATASLVDNLTANSITTGNPVVSSPSASESAPPAPTPALLDQLPSGASAAFGLSRLTDSYTGFAIRVRRDSDNLETNIGFDSLGFLDVAALEAFQAGAANTRLVTWYDQTGSGNDINQTNASQQPYVSTVTGGVFSMLFPYPNSGRNGVFFSGGEFLDGFQLYNAFNFTAITAFRPFNNSAGQQTLFNLAAVPIGSNVFSSYAHTINSGFLDNYVINRVDLISSSNDSTPNLGTGGNYIVTDFHSALNGTQAYADGILMTGSSTSTSSTAGTVIGAINNTPTNGFVGSIYTLILYPAALNSDSNLINTETSNFFNSFFLSASGTTSGNPVLGAPVGTVTANLAALPITTGASVTGTPTLTTAFNLSAAPLIAQSHILGQPDAFSALQLPTFAQTNIIVNKSKLHLFPDYKIGLSLNYSAGSIEGLEAGISDNFEVPFDDYNAGILGVNLLSLSAGQRFDCTIEDEASNTIYEGYLEVISASVQTLYKSIELRFVDRVKRFVNTLKDTKLHELISAGEFDHDFQLAKPADTFTGVESLVNNSDFVRYVYTDYNGFDNLNVAALHRYNEDFAGGDGIQHLQPAFKVNEFINRIESFTGETITSQFFSNGISGIDTDKLYFQVPMRYHGFNTSLREDNLILTFNNSFMYAGFPEAEYEVPLFGFNINYRANNRAIKLKASMADQANNFEVFMRDAVVASQDWLQQAITDATNTQFEPFIQFIASLFKGLAVLRSGTYNLSGTVAIPELNIAYVDPDPTQSNVFLQGLQSFTGDLVLNLGVIVNGNNPTLIPVKTYNHTDFSTAASTSAVQGGVTYYNFFRAASDTVSYTSEDIELRMGDRVEFVWVLTGEGEQFTVGRLSASGSFNQITNLTVYDMSNTSGYSNLIFTLGTGSSSIPAPFNATTKGFLSAVSLGSGLSHAPTITASREYPLCGIPQSRILTNPALPAEYESIDFKENVKRFADISVYDILMDVMGRFNMGAWYSHLTGTFYFDNFSEQYVRTATAQIIKSNFDDDDVLSINLQAPDVRSIELQNTKGNSQKDIVLGEYEFGTYPSDVLDEDGAEDVKYKSMFSLANGKNYGEEVQLSEPMSTAEKYLRFYSKNENLNVSEYGLRIGFLSDSTKKITVATPHPANFFLPQAVNLHDFVRYKARQNSAFTLPIFQHIDQTNNLTLEFAVEDSGVLNPEPTTTTTVYEKFWKWYVENMFGTVGLEGSFVFSKDEIKSLAPIEVYNFGYGDCVIESVDSFDLTEEKDKVRIKFRKI